MNNEPAIVEQYFKAILNFMETHPHPEMCTDDEVLQFRFLLRIKKDFSRKERFIPDGAVERDIHSYISCLMFY